MDRLKEMLKQKSADAGKAPVEEEFDEELEEDESSQDESDDEFEEEVEEDFDEEEDGEQEEESDEEGYDEAEEPEPLSASAGDTGKGFIVKAHSIEEGLEIASKKIHVPITSLEYEILQKGSHGFLGMGKRPFIFRIMSTSGAAATGAGAEIPSGTVLFPDQDLAEMVQKPVNVDGFFKIRLTKKGIMLKVVAPIGKGKKASAEEVQQYLFNKTITDIPLPSIRDAVLKADGLFIKIGEWAVGNIANISTAVCELSDDEMHAYVRIIPPKMNGPVLEEEDIIQILSQRNVVEGINRETIQHMLEDEVYHQPVEVATGKPAVPGDNARIEYKFKTSQDTIQLSEDEKTGKVDYHNLNLVENVVIGQVLAVKIPFTKAQVGKSVTGKRLEARDGQDVPLQPGHNSKLSDDRLKILAEINGQVVLTKGVVNVEPIYEVGGDVGLSTGNIVFLGTVLVRGNVDDGFTIKAAGNVDIRGSVGKSKIEAEGDIYMRQGLAGKDGAEIISGHDIYAKFIEHAKLIKAENDIVVSEGLMHSHVSAGKRVILNGKRGMIVGGHVLAGEEVNAKTLGSPANTETLIEVGIDPKSREELTGLEEERRDLKDKMKEIGLNLNTLVEQKKNLRGKLPPDREEMLISLSTQKEEMTRRLNEVEERITQIRSYLDALEEKGKIAVQKIVFPKVKVMVKDAGLEVRDEFQYVTFVQEAGNIKVLPYEETTAKKSLVGLSRGGQ
jgi:uncharacterized protein